MIDLSDWIIAGVIFIICTIVGNFIDEEFGIFLGGFTGFSAGLIWLLRVGVST